MKMTARLVISLIMLTLPAPVAGASQRVFLRLIATPSAAAAATAVQRLENGETFASVARDVSRDPSAARGGYLGELSLSQMNQEFLAAVKNLEPGRWSQPFQLGTETLIVYRQPRRFREDAYERAAVGEEHLNAGRLDQAIGSLKEALEIFPDFIHAHFLLGVVYSKKADLAREIASYKEAVRIEPKYDKAYYNLGLAYLKGGDLGAAIQALRRAVEVKPDCTDCWISLSAAYLSQRQVREAVSSAQRAIQINPMRPAGHYNLGSALSQVNPAMALEAFEMAITLTPDRPDFHLAVAVVKGQMGQVEEAVKILQRLARDYPDFQPAQQLLSQIQQ